MNTIPKKQRRTAYLKVTVTKDEKSQFRALAASRHTDLSEMVRQMLHREVAQSKEQAA